VSGGGVRKNGHKGDKGGGAMRKYVVTSKFFEGEMVYGYNSEGILVFFENKAELQTEHLNWLFKNFPVVDNQLPKTFPKSKITEATDLTFEAFWEAYAYKVGDKRAAAKAWRQLGESERLAIFEHLPKYNYHLKTTGVGKAYPSTFLNQRRWENQYKS